MASGELASQSISPPIVELPKMIVGQLSPKPASQHQRTENMPRQQRPIGSCLISEADQMQVSSWSRQCLQRPRGRPRKGKAGVDPNDSISLRFSTWPSPAINGSRWCNPGIDTVAGRILLTFAKEMFFISRLALLSRCLSSPDITNKSQKPLQVVEYSRGLTLASFGHEQS
jgi:hypothetical protein